MLSPKSPSQKMPDVSIFICPSIIKKSVRTASCISGPPKTPPPFYFLFFNLIFFQSLYSICYYADFTIMLAFVCTCLLRIWICPELWNSSGSLNKHPMFHTPYTSIDIYFSSPISSIDCSISNRIPSILIHPAIFNTFYSSVKF